VFEGVAKSVGPEDARRHPHATHKSTLDCSSEAFPCLLLPFLFPAAFPFHCCLSFLLLPFLFTAAFPFYCCRSEEVAHLVLHERSERQVVEQVREALPHVRVAVLPQALVVEAVPAGRAELASCAVGTDQELRSAGAIRNWVWVNVSEC